jgi:hypothetical protein
MPLDSTYFLQRNSDLEYVQYLARVDDHLTGFNPKALGAKFF